MQKRELESYEIKEAVGFVSGFLAGLGGHEFGHKIASDSQHAGINFSGKKCDFSSGATDSQYENSFLGGFASEIMSSEIILAKNKNSKIILNNNFILGYMFWNIAHPVVYVIRHESFKSNSDDLSGIEWNGGDSSAIETLIVSQALWSIWRLYDGEKELKIFSLKKTISSPFFEIVPPTEKNNRQIQFEFGIRWQN
ncbi:MAG TPA: hypothetical protein P5232_04460 [Candidatus Moranbacteria bacterium]|nr:hypothetical protein [Candidatus Moranbacteria bacterium]